MKHLLPAALLIAISACAHNDSKSLPPERAANVSAGQIERILQLKAEYKASAIGIGVIKAGELAWTGYYGEQSPGVPASASTLFNTASVSKAVTTETFLRLVASALVSLDEPIFPYYEHPDLVDDPRFRRLTPRTILTHRTGLKNWAHSYEDGKLAFLHDPGDRYGYSGAGFMMLANFLERKLDKPFPQIVRETIFDPIGMEGASVVQEPWMAARVAHPVMSDGRFRPNFELDYGYWNSADDLYVTVEDYVKFLISVMNDEGIDPTLAAERVRVQSDLTHDSTWGCSDGAIDLCPTPYGHGLGWFVFGYDENRNVQHGGNDESEAAIAYFDTETHDGMIVFVNAANPNGVLLWPKIVDLLDDDAEFTDVFHHIIAKFFGETQ